MLLSLSVALATLVAMLLLAYLARLPEGRRCPRCGERLEPDAGDVAEAVRRWSFGAVVVRRCPACGWNGRTRGARDAEPVRIRSDERRDVR